VSEAARARILVVDDDSAVRGLLSRVLVDSGCPVECAADTSTALAACRRGPFAAATVDQRLPGAGGSDLAATIHKSWPDTAVIVAIGIEDTASAVKCMRAGAYDYLVKPFDLDEVVLRVGRALEHRRLRLENRRHQEELEIRARRQTRSTRSIFLGAIQSLCSALEAKDDYTRGHSERVSRIATAIGRAIGLAPRDLRRVRLAARLHDIGKIGVKEGVLSKPGGLADDERRHIHIHPVLGEHILAPVLRDREMVRIVRHHHESYAGGGYPDDLQRSAIPLGARILAVADAFDALTSDRPYRPRLPLDAAIGILREGAGSQWQPTLVETLERRLDRVWPIIWRRDGREPRTSGEAPQRR
jgi:putative nucleotidyltransferase with HDIG domain